MAFLRALQRALPQLSSPVAALLRRAPHALPPPPAPLRFLDPIGLRPFSAAATASQAPPMGANLFSGLMDTRFPKRRPGFANRRKRASLRPKGVEDFFGLSFLAIEMLRSGLFFCIFLIPFFGIPHLNGNMALPCSLFTEFCEVSWIKCSVERSSTLP